MSNRDQANPSSATRAGVGTRIKGVFETAHGIGDNVRGRTLGTIDDITNSGTAESKSNHASLAHRGFMEAEKGMAHIRGYADPDVYHDELTRMSNSTSQTFGNGHTTEMGPGKHYVREEEGDYHGGGGRMDGGFSRDTGGHGTDDGRDRLGARDFEQEQPGIDRNTQSTGPVTDEKGLHNADSNNPAQQRTKRDPPPELPPRPQTQAADNERPA